MNNAEGYKAKIRSFAHKYNSDEFAIDKNNRCKLILCENMDCSDCIFYDPLDKCSCGNARLHWLVAKYWEPEFKLTQLEYDILNYFKELGFVYIARDKNGTLKVAKCRLKNKFDGWNIVDSAYRNDCREIRGFNELFKFVEWNDGLNLPIAINVIFESYEIIENDI